MGFSRALCNTHSGLILRGVEGFPGSHELSEIPVVQISGLGRHWPHLPNNLVWIVPSSAGAKLVFQCRLHGGSQLINCSSPSMTQDEFEANTGCCKGHSAKMLMYLSTFWPVYICISSSAKRTGVQTCWGVVAPHPARCRRVFPFPQSQSPRPNRPHGSMPFLQTRLFCSETLAVARQLPIPPPILTHHGQGIM